MIFKNESAILRWVSEKSDDLVQQKFRNPLASELFDS